ncbi:hypothetical protein MH138_04325 [Bacillus safensis]|uniref:hypothetical protein n=1 Tax=Bacillus safensis TaxID=561879 RepID=UPI00227FD02C|nr:hypothetical protein [Bacillus safensis]MCY7585275.1 hypothetical protein [Bacillus safensis]MCY7586766.1 hypothetical protein [Bacillus safensis]MCY7610562.1 hypothetical protein [Bacillus safensis]
MKELPLKMILLAFAIFVVGILVYYYTTDYKQHSIINTMNESARIASMRNVDNSIRTEEGKVELSERAFELNFESSFKEKSNVKLGKTSFKYKYLKDVEGKMKAVKIILTDQKNKEYRTTLVVDRPKGERK